MTASPHRPAKALLLTLLLAGLPAASLAKPEPRTGWSQGAYIWDSRALLNPQQRPHELQRLKQQGITHLLVGLTAEQVRNSGTPASMRALLQQAHASGQRVQLLLGDPAWINPAQRPQLLSLIERFRSVPFDGLHLDLEVEQLGWPVPARRLQQWLNTVRSVRQTSPWPLSLSSHPRWFERPSTPCVPCGLNGVAAVNLMIYQRNGERVSERSKAIAQRWPRLHFRLAQSVEPGLDPGESWYGSSAGALQLQVQRWRRALASDGIGGIDWQDWAAYPKGR